MPLLNSTGNGGLLGRALAGMGGLLSRQPAPNPQRPGEPYLHVPGFYNQGIAPLAMGIFGAADPTGYASLLGAGSAFGLGGRTIPSLGAYRQGTPQTAPAMMAAQQGATAAYGGLPSANDAYARSLVAGQGPSAAYGGVASGYGRGRGAGGVSMGGGSGVQAGQGERRGQRNR